MMISVYYRKEDEWILQKVDEICVRQRKSRSAVILSILEHYFERGKKVGQIFRDMGLISQKQLEDTLKLQEIQKQRKKLGQMLREEGIISERHIQRALTLQRKDDGNA